MKKNLSALTMVFACASLALPAHAQMAPVPPAASAASAVKPGPRTLSPAEKRDSSESPSAALPETKAVPQLAIPLNRPGNIPGKPGPASPRAATGGVVADGAARCLAEESAAAREACQAKANEKKR